LIERKSMAKRKTVAKRRQPTAPTKDVEPDADAEVQSAEDNVEAAREQLQAAEAMLEQVREKAVERVAWLRNQSTGELLDTSLDFVRKHPGLGVLAAASVGYFVGRLIRR
jgi:ElaB/YqjD/DUF883 family membrane-anchored ribosome-binding protein